MDSHQEPSASPSDSPSVSSPSTPSTSTGDLVSKAVRDRLAYTIMVMWITGIVADVVMGDAFTLSPYVYFTMIGLASSVFGSNFVKDIRG